MADWLQLDTPGGYTFHSYRRSAATVVADAGATSEQMSYFFANKLAASDKTLATSSVSTTVKEVAVVGKEKKITTVELNRGDESEEL